MQLILDTYANTGNLHHVYCIVGDRVSVFRTLKTFLEDTLGFQTQGNPDYWHGEFDSFGIDDGRKIKEIHTSKAFRQDSRKIFIIKTNTITREAQNSLLKIFEEPGEGNHFFIIMPSVDILLPTLLSRVLVVDGYGGTGRAGEARAAQKAGIFLSSSLKTRLELVKEFLEEVSNEEKTKSDVSEFLGELEHLFYTKNSQAILTPEHALRLEELITFRSYLNDRSSSLKMILEHIALVFPRLK